VLVLWFAPKLQPATGTLLVIGAGRTATTLPEAGLMLGQAGSWSPVGTVSGGIPAAPDQRQLLEAAVPPGTYQGVRVGDAIEPVTVVITAGQVEPLLLGVEGGKLIPGAAYAGNDDVNLGLGELAGRFVAIPAFSLTDQAGRPFTLDTIAGKDVVIAAFHTTCHETCPLYTALFLQLARQRQTSVELVEVTTDPGTDTPSVLAQYAKQIGATWTFATGTADELSAFWKPFAVELATGDTHTSTLALLDRHGYVRLVYRGVPKVGNDIPPSLVSTLSAKGLTELASGGDGWGAPDVLQALTTIGRGEPSPAAAGGAAPAFALPATDGSTQRFDSPPGRPTVINFWGTYCPPCRAELPMLDRALAAQPGVRLILVDEADSASSARDFLARSGVDRATLLDSDLAVGRQFGVSALPMTIFVRADGTIDRRQIGQLDERVLVAELSVLGSQ
jgi:cytochrome oxidase Cu insertion factor (SCO1/SenC/PrrC family)/thiol-disulfide isomerase/thioredoxin